MVEQAGMAEEVGRPAFCGRAVTDEEWSVLVEIVETCGVSRSELARTICEGLRWVRANGGLKTRECYEYLGTLEARGLLRGLPAVVVQRPHGPTSIRFTRASERRPEREGELSEVSPVTIGLVSTSEERGLFRELVERYHYLGHKVPYGAHLRYLVWTEKPRRELAGCVQFSSAARRVDCRDRFIGWDDATRQRNLTQVVNNSRFLILPWLHIRGLASHVLSICSRVVPQDWQERYGISPVLLETFVLTERYEGTCYRAANWIEVGQTSGRGRMDRDHDSAVSVKTLFVYPLSRDFRRRLGAFG
jgi:hypothetical protein